MKDLIEALTIFLKYVEPDSYQSKFPTHCEHDIMYINCSTEPNDMADEDAARLGELGFDYSEDNYGWYSYAFGSC